MVLLKRIFFFWATLWTAIVTVFAGLGTVITFLISSNPKGFNFWSRVWGFGILSGVGIRVRTYGLENVPRTGSFVFAINHQVGLDIPAVGSAIPVPFGWVAKAELARVPFLGHAIKASPSVFIDRSHPKRSIESMRLAGEKIRQGVSVAIFPEGSRSHGATLGPFKRGAFLLAIEAQVPVIPVTIVNGYQLYNEKQRVARPGVMHIHFGSPIDITGWTRADIPRLTARVRAEMLERLGLPAESDSPETED